MRREAGSQESTHPFLENTTHAEPGPAAPRGHGMGREEGREKGIWVTRNEPWFARVPRPVAREEQVSREEMQIPGGNVENPARFAPFAPRSAGHGSDGAEDRGAPAPAPRV